MLTLSEQTFEITRGQELIYELRVEDVMQREVISVTSQTTMREFKELLRVKRISGTPVVDGGKLVGIISLEDLIKALEEGDMDTAVVRKMTPNVEVLYADEPVVHAVNRMSRRGFGRFPVLDRSERLVGILTRGEIIRGLLRRLEVTYREEEIHRYRASHIFEDITSDRTSLVMRYWVKGKDLASGGAASSRIKRAIGRLGGDPLLARRVGVAAYEAEMNLVIHADNGGEIMVEIHPDQVYVLVTDAGPGIADVEQASRPGFSTAPDWIRELGFGAGMGLVNIKRCADEMKLQSVVGQGTWLEIWFQIPSPQAKGSGN